MGRNAGTNLSDGHKENISAGMKRLQQEKRDKNHRNFWNSMHAHERHQVAAEATTAAERPGQIETAVLVPQENTADNVVDKDLVVEENTQPIVPNLDIDDEDDDEMLENDAHDGNSSDGTIMHRYIRAIQDRLQTELSRNFPATEKPWLKWFLKENDWWIPQEKYREISRDLNLEFDKDEMEPAYFRKVYVWLPDERWGKICMPACPKCKSNKYVGNNGFRDNHFGRRVVALNHDYYCLSRRYRCSKCEEEIKQDKKGLEDSAAAKGLEIQVLEKIHKERHYTFMAWNQTTLELYPHGFGSEFPAFLTYRAGVDRLLLDLMRPLFDKGFRPLALADTILELHAKSYHRECLKHELEIAKMGNVDQKPMLSEFGDKSRYNGGAPTSRYLSHVYKVYHDSIKDFLDTEVKKRDARRIHVDASYKEAKHLCQYHGLGLFKGLITITNEHGEIRSQFHVVTDDHEQLRPALIAFAKTQQAYGQPDVELVFTDNVKGDRNFYLEMFPSVRAAQERLDKITDKSATAPDDSTEDNTVENACKINDDQIVVMSNKNEINTFITALDEMIGARPAADQVVGLDAEWNVETGRRGLGKKFGKLALLILAYMDDEGKPRARLLRLHKFSSLPDQLLKFLAGNTTFVGNNVGGDISKIGRDYKCVETMKKVAKVNLGQFARTRDVVPSGNVGLDVLVRVCLNETLSKEAEIRVSNKWEGASLSQAQKKYAALDGVKSLEVYLFLRDKPDLTKRLSMEEAKSGLSVDIAPHRYNTGASIVATRCAIGRLTDDTRETWNVPDGKPWRLNRQGIPRKKYKVVEVLEVVAPHFNLPYLKKENGEPVCLGDFDHTRPFRILLPLTMLKNHIDSSNIRPFPDMLAPIRAGPTPPAPPQTSTPQNSPANTMRPEVPANDEGAIGINQIDEDGDDAGLNLSMDDVTMLKKVCIDWYEAASGKKVLHCDHLDAPPSAEEICDVFSAVLGDIFHVMDRPKVPYQHCAKKLFMVAFRDALLQWDPILLDKVKAALKRKDGKTDHQLEASLYYNASFWKDCVPRRVLPPRLLYWRVRAVFVAFGNIIDPKSEKPLFNKAAWNKANNILEEILLGYYSDPPGYSFYKIKLNDKGEQMMNAYGFDLLSCNRGTTDVENFHKIVVTTFGTWHCGIEMSDCLLRERRHRHNHKCSERRRLGFPRFGHYDTWMIDKLQLLVQANHGVILYPHWVNSSDYKSTPETFGTIVLHDEELSNALATIELEKEVKLTHDMQYLCKVMGTKLPLLPVHTKAERTVFSKLILRNIMDPRQQALEWVKEVNGVDVFPKLPVHLRNYRNRFDQNARARQAFGDTSESREILAALNDSLCPRPKTSDGGSNQQEATQQLNDYTHQWEPVVEPQPLLPVAPVAIEPRNLYVGGMLIDKAPEVIRLERVVDHANRNGKRGRDDPAKQRSKRRCMECVKNGVSDEQARLCKGTNKKSRCPYHAEE